MLRRTLFGLLSLIPGVQLLPKEAQARPQLGFVPTALMNELLERKLQEPDGLAKLMRSATIWLKGQTADRGGLRNVPSEVGYERVVKVMEAASTRLETQVRTDLPQSLREQATAVFLKGYDECAKAQLEPHLIGQWPASLTVTIDFEYPDGVHLVSRPAVKL